MQKTEGGVHISQKEIYELVLKIGKTVDRMESNLDARLSIMEKTDERSRKALNVAENNAQRVNAMQALIEKVEKNQVWLWTTVVGVLLTSAIKALFSIEGG